MAQSTAPAPAPTIGELFAVFLRIGLLSFGGPAGQISLLHRILVDERQWLSERQFLNALNFCMLLPGPEAMQLATYSGWRIKGIAGGLMAGLLFVIPGALVIFALAALYAAYGQVGLVHGLFLGIKAAVLVIVIEALLRISNRALGTVSHRVIALAGFTGIFFLDFPFPAIVIAAGLWGYWFLPNHPTAEEADGAQNPESNIPLGRTIITAAAGLCLWFVPIAAAGALIAEPVIFDLGLFFSKLAVVTFGGAYAVLAYMAQDAVSTYGWLSAGEMLDGLGLAETTPGPLILVTQFVGYIAAYREGGLWLGVAGMGVTLWATFAPCFVWIFAGAPYIDRLARHPRLTGALSAITAAVVGVILNLSIWFALHVFFADVTRENYGPVSVWLPALASIDYKTVILSIVAALLLMRWKINLLWVLALCSLAGLGLAYLT